MDDQIMMGVYHTILWLNQTGLFFKNVSCPVFSSSYRLFNSCNVLKLLMHISSAYVNTVNRIVDYLLLKLDSAKLERILKEQCTNG